MSASNNKITYLDLFAGAGGLSEGFASTGYQPIAHVEMDQDACSTLKTRESYYYLNSNGMNCKYFDYLKGKISRDEFYGLIPDGILNFLLKADKCLELEQMPIAKRQSTITHGQIYSFHS